MTTDQTRELSDDKLYDFWLHRDCLPAILAGDMREQFITAARAAIAADRAARAAPEDVEPSEAMVSAYLKANDAYWHGIDANPMGPRPDAREAVRVSLRASLAAACTRAPAVPAGWLPIETAPKDGARIILTNGESVAEGSWLHAEPYIREKRDIDGCYIDQDESDGFDDWVDSIGGMTPSPTHWMPLPAAPTQADPITTPHRAQRRGAG